MNNSDAQSREDVALALIAKAEAEGLRGPMNYDFILAGVVHDSRSVRPFLSTLEEQGKISIEGEGPGRTIKVLDINVEPAGNLIQSRTPAGKIVSGGFDQETLDAMVIIACRAAGYANPVIPGRSNA